MAFGQEDDDNDYSGKPVEEGETYEVEIDDLGSKGDGIARVDGFVVFVPETEVGERVDVEINSVGRRFAFGEVVDRLGHVEEDGGGAETAETPEEMSEEPVEEAPESAEEPVEEVPVEDEDEEELEEPAPAEPAEGGPEEHDPYGLDEDEESEATDAPAEAAEAAEAAPAADDDYDKEEVEERSVEEDLDADLQGDPAKMEELENRVEEALAEGPEAEEPTVCENCGAEVTDPATHECA